MIFRDVILLVFTIASIDAVPRDIIIRNGQFVDANNKTVLLSGANVVMKGAPWLPAVSGDSFCHDTHTTTCKTFNKHDAIHITQDMGWNFIRLGVTWAGAQPTQEPVLDPKWVARLHAILELCHDYGIYVILDMHEDAVGTAVCGEGVPQWFSAIATPDQIGKPLWPLNHGCSRDNTTAWALHAGEDDYNTKNPCCLQINQGGWSQIVTTVQAQATMAYLFSEYGRKYYATYMGLLAKAVVDYPAAVGIELMNEPPAIERGTMYETWEACYNAIHAEVEDMAVGVMDTGEAPLPIGDLDLSGHTVAWLKSASHLFYAFHWYSTPKTPEEAVKNAIKLSSRWGMPAVLTEFMSCKVQKVAKESGIGWAYWHYSQYCDTPPSSQCLPGHPCDFGACITGWGAGNSNFTCP